jgi:hypothetical protein
MLKNGGSAMAKSRISFPVDLVTIGAAVIIVAFFLPWIKLGGSFAGYEIPDIAHAAGKATSLKSWTGKFDINVYLVYSLFLVPISAAAIIAFGAMGKDRTIPAWIAAVMPTAGFVYGFIRLQFDLFPRLGVGGWLTVAAGVLILLALLNVIKMPGKR